MFRKTILGAGVALALGTLAPIALASVESFFNDRVQMVESMETRACDAMINHCARSIDVLEELDARGASPHYMARMAFLMQDFIMQEGARAVAAVHVVARKAIYVFHRMGASEAQITRFEKRVKKVADDIYEMAEIQASVIGRTLASMT